VETLYHPTDAIELAVFALLQEGRTAESSYDVKHSPVATFLVKLLGFDRIRSLLVTAKKFFKGEVSDREFLECVEEEVVAQITSATLQLFDARRAALAGGSVQKL
jgi:hypothetical protein